MTGGSACWRSHGQCHGEHTERFVRVLRRRRDRRGALCRLRSSMNTPYAFVDRVGEIDDQLGGYLKSRSPSAPPPSTYFGARRRAAFRKTRQLAGARQTLVTVTVRDTSGTSDGVRHQKRHGVCARGRVGMSRRRRAQCRAMSLKDRPNPMTHVCAFDRRVLLIFTVTDPTPETFPAPSIVPPLTPVKSERRDRRPGRRQRRRPADVGNGTRADRELGFGRDREGDPRRSCQ